MLSFCGGGAVTCRPLQPPLGLSTPEEASLALPAASLSAIPGIPLFCCALFLPPPWCSCPLGEAGSRWSGYF